MTSDLGLHCFVPIKVCLAGIFLQFWEVAVVPFRLLKLARQTWEICLSTQLCHFWSIKNKIAITHTFAIKLKDNVTMYFVCVLTEWKSQSSKKKQKNFFSKIGIFFFKIGKKAPKFHWEWGRMRTPKNNPCLAYYGLR